MRKALLLAMVSFAFAGAAAAETVYVTDILQLGLHEAQDTSDQPFRQLRSGTELEVIDRVPNFALVEAPDGQRGWVKSTFLVTEKPAQLIVAEIGAELDSLRQELDAARAARTTAEAERQSALEQAAAARASTDALEDGLRRLTAEKEEYEAQVNLYRGALPLSWVAGAIVAALAAGFGLGLWCLDAYIRRRHGGFRVY